MALNRSVESDWGLRARKALPHGVSSYARFREQQVVFERASGAHLFDTEDRAYVDCVLGFGPLFLGHRHPKITEAVHHQMGRIDLSGGVTPVEIALAERLIEVVPCAEKILFQSSGSEAAHLALRIARNTTKRRLIVKFEGHYHGWLDPLYVRAPGVTPTDSRSNGPRTASPNGSATRIENEVITLDWGDFDALHALMSARGSEIAAVVMEPIPYNFGAFAPDPDYLRRVRELCTDRGSLLIFDEVVSGFRISLGGAQGSIGVHPDLALYGKAIGSGFPIAFVAGTDAALASVADGEVRQAGTYNALPIGMAAGLATLDVLTSHPEIYSEAERRAGLLGAGIDAIAHQLHLPITINRVGSVMQAFWGLERAPQTYRAATQSDSSRIAALFNGATAHGAYLAPRGLLYISAAHTDDDLQTVIDALSESARAL